MKLVATTLDCPDPLALAAFYQQATGLELHPKSDAGFAGLNGEHGLLIGFQRVEDYRAPAGPARSFPGAPAARGQGAGSHRSGDIPSASARVDRCPAMVRP
ncbi:VOC family protein [Streptomyces caniscabiei]|nr:VOC family protein [Streptomyces caniscabiei]